MLTLHFGVLDLAYSDADASGANTTGEVAEILENKYHVMRIFAEENFDLIEKTVADALEGEMETARTAGRKPSISNLFTQKIDQRFRQFLSNREIEAVLPFTIQAAQEGISHRFKDPSGKTVRVQDIVSGKATAYQKVLKMKRSPRPAFIDTGLYQQSFISWID